MSFKYEAVTIPEEWKKTPALLTVNPLCLEVLRRRGYKTVEEVTALLYPNFSEVVKNTEFQDSAKAIDRLADAVHNREHIVVYQDYDVDGCSACAIMVENLRNFGGYVDYYGNDRAIDGFGMCSNGVHAIKVKYPDVKLILTVDNGIVAFAGVETAIAEGIEVIITDHHQPGNKLPDAEAVVDLQRKDEAYPFHDFCGAGLALKLMFALAKKLRANLNDVAKSTDLAALATVADVVPVLGENRAIIREGLKYINDGSRLLFQVLNAVKNEQKITAHETLAFRYAPMINAVSRMGYDTGTVVEMMLSHDKDFVTEKVLELDKINEDRKEETKREFNVADETIDSDKLEKSIVICDESFKEGIVGIVAGKLKETYNRPTIVFADVGNGILKGSGRSVEGFNLKENLDEVRDLLLGYGGHTMAAGMTLKKENFDEFKRRFSEIAEEKVSTEVCDEPVLIDLVVHAKDLTENLLCDMSIMEPYGEGFPVPCFGLIADIDKVFYMGKEEAHVKWVDSENGVSVITWNGAEAAKARTSYPKKFVGYPSLHEYNGRVDMQFMTYTA